ncbi:MAG: DNA translocase FtsK [Limosilactobacillus sp.]|nr:DNA translocase FtsK [Limosilactobacillus sp.]
MAKQKKRATKSRRKRTSPKTPPIDQRVIRALSGILIILLTLLGLFNMGSFGRLIRGGYQIIGGQAMYLIMAVVLFDCLGLVLKGQRPHWRRRCVVGGGIFYVGLVTFLHFLMFQSLQQSSHIFATTWSNLATFMSTGDTTLPIGGGMSGALVYWGLSPLIEPLGAAIAGWLMIVIGIIIFFGLPWQKAILGLQALVMKLQTQLKERRTKKLMKRQESPAPSPVKKPEPTPAAVNKPIDDEVPVNERYRDTRPNPAMKDLPTPLSERALEPKINVAAAKPSPAKSNDESHDDVALAGVNGTAVDEDYQLPPSTLLASVAATDQSDDLNVIKENTQKLQSTLLSFGVEATVENVNLGPTVTKYELRPAVGVKVSKITHLADDLALALAAKDIRIEAPIPGKSLIGIEVPNTKIATVGFRDVIEATPATDKPLMVPLGRTVTGKVMTADLTRMPHLLIAGSTGSGKSVAINGIVTSILMHARPNQVKLLMIDPKKVELSVYNGIPHLLSPVVSEPKKAARALGKVVAEMERRYELFASFNVRNLAGYNQMVREHQADQQPELPLILVIVDELADLMMTVSNDVETAIVRIAQMGRAAGIHMILATQRPSVDVITGLIKANVPSRIAFAVSSGIDSRTILDANGAEKLLGRGDMLFQPIDQNKPTRVQGAFISDQDVEAVVNFIKAESQADYDERMVVSDAEMEQIAESQDEDPLFNEVLSFVVDQQKASTSMVQRRFSIGYNRAARIIDDLEQRGYIGPANGSKPREVYKEAD